MTSAQVVETSVTNNSSSQNYTHPDDHTIRTLVYHKRSIKIITLENYCTLFCRIGEYWFRLSLWSSPTYVFQDDLSRNVVYSGNSRTHERVQMPSMRQRIKMCFEQRALANKVKPTARYYDSNPFRLHVKYLPISMQSVMVVT